MESIDFNAEHLNKQMAKLKRLGRERKIAREEKFSKKIAFSQASSFYEKKNAECTIDFDALAFKYNKFIMHSECCFSIKRDPKIISKLIKDIESLAKNLFDSADYVLVISNKPCSTKHEFIRLLYEGLNKFKRGKITHRDRYPTAKPKYIVGNPVALKDSKIEVSVNAVQFDLLLYEGDLLSNQNILLLEEEFGANELLSKLIIDSRPKNVLNLLTKESNSFWFDNVD